MGLSPGDHHEFVPREPLGNLDFREEVYGEKDPVRRAALKRMCSEDILFYTNAFVWTIDQRREPRERVVPFVTWGRQDEVLLEMVECVELGQTRGVDAVMEKSRDQGASWLCLILFEWLWHFVPWGKFLVVSKDEKSVENAADPDSLFWKIDFIHEYLPKWLMPAGYDRAVHRRHSKAGSFYNPEMKSRITGSASTGSAGVGGRATAIFVDEFSQIKEDHEVLHRTSNTSNCRIFNGTHLGTSTALYELTQRPEPRKLRLHWTDHPVQARGLYRWDQFKQEIEVLDKSYEFPPDYKFVCDGSPTGGPRPGVRSPWYDNECVRKGSARAVAMDLDIDPKNSSDQFFDPILVRTLQGSYCRPPVWVGDAKVSEEGKALEFVRGDSGKTSLWIHFAPEGTVPPSRYAAGADISEGRGATPSCLTILDAVTGMKVLEYASAWVKPREFAVLAVALCRAFSDLQGRPAKLAWEAQGPGEEFGQEVINLGFSSVYFRTDEFVLNKKASDRPGWYPTPQNKRKVMSDYRDALRQRQVENPSERALEETLAFEEGHGGIECDLYPVKGDPSGASLCHGDRVVADALAWMMKLKIVAPQRPGQVVRPTDPEVVHVLSVAGRHAEAERLAREEAGW